MCFSIRVGVSQLTSQGYDFIPGHTWSSSRFTFRRETRYTLSEILKGSGHAPPPPVVCSTVLALGLGPAS